MMTGLAEVSGPQYTERLGCGQGRSVSPTWGGFPGGGHRRVSAPARTSGRGVGAGCPGGGWPRGGDAGTEAVSQLVVYPTFFFQFSYILFKLNIKQIYKGIIFLMVGLK